MKKSFLFALALSVLLNIVLGTVYVLNVFNTSDIITTQNILLDGYAFQTNRLAEAILDDHKDLMALRLSTLLSTNGHLFAILADHNDPKELALEFSGISLEATNLLHRSQDLPTLTSENKQLILQYVEGLPPYDNLKDIEELKLWADGRYDILLKNNQGTFTGIENDKE